MFISQYACGFAACSYHMLHALDFTKQPLDMLLVLGTFLFHLALIVAVFCEQFNQTCMRAVCMCVHMRNVFVRLYILLHVNRVCKPMAWAHVFRVSSVFYSNGRRRRQPTLLIIDVNQSQTVSLFCITHTQQQLLISSFF